jgi:hypothetical protein
MRNKLLMVLLIGVLLALLAVPTCAADADFTEESVMETSADYEDEYNSVSKLILRSLWGF